jgi:DUF971 family protein
MKNHPLGIKVHKKEKRLAIQWQDSHESTYTFTLLRNACPCAECRGHENMGPTPDPEVFRMPEEESPRTLLEDVEAVGGYAITLYWQDGHHFGIYNWEYLRALCACETCRG